MSETMKRYAVVIEKADGNYSAYVPDLPGCVATGPTVQAIEAEIRDAIRFHIEGLQADGLDVPEPTSIAEYVEA
jgi:predicted RNase H-like HicB family nuclease